MHGTAPELLQRELLTSAHACALFPTCTFLQPSFVSLTSFHLHEREHLKQHHLPSPEQSLHPIVELLVLPRSIVWHSLAEHHAAFASLVLLSDIPST
jgi:hypothetical protein